jgi:hypothetical protein
MCVTARRRVPRNEAPCTALGAQGTPHAIEPSPHIGRSLRLVRTSNPQTSRARSEKQRIEIGCYAIPVTLVTK